VGFSIPTASGILVGREGIEPFCGHEFIRIIESKPDFPPYIQLSTFTFLLSSETYLPNKKPLRGHLRGLGAKVKVSLSPEVSLGFIIHLDYDYKTEQHCKTPKFTVVSSDGHNGKPSDHLPLAVNEHQPSLHTIIQESFLKVKPK